MCGIAGQYVPGGTADIDTLEAMNQCVRHRGPDDAGYFRDGPVGLAHRRLSIIDIEGGGQPIYNEAGDVVVIFNGEIYNYRDLRESLSAAGHTFTTETDTEVLVHLYEEHGPSFVDHLDGMFAFALWDAGAEELHLARDPVGIKPLVIAETDDCVTFASELPSVLAADIDLGGLDREVLAQYFAFGHVPAPNTAFQNVSKVRPGERVTVTDAGITRTRYYRLDVPERSPGLDAAASELRTRIEDAVERRLMSDVPVGAFLSGGIDSSIVVGTMADMSDEPISTFTVGFDRDRFDETWAAREVAEYHGTDHTTYTVSADDVRRAVPDVLDRLGEPFADPSLLPSYVVARETSSEVKVALSGDGADELFAGYDKYRVESLSKYYRALPRAVRSQVVEPVVNRLPASRGTRAGEFAYKGRWFVNRAGVASVPDRHFQYMRRFESAATDTFPSLDPESAGRRAVETQHRRLPDNLRNRDDLTRIQSVDVRYSLPDQILSKVDLASMYNSLEVRVPLLDTSVIEYGLSLPTEYRIDRRNRKRVLKRGFADVMPESIRKRGKQGFDMPVGEWFKNELASEFRDVLASVDLGVLDDDAVRRIHDEHTRGRNDHAEFLWSVYVYKRWAARMRDRGVLEAT